jgi:phospholipid transport system substrate-binding protein
MNAIKRVSVLGFALTMLLTVAPVSAQTRGGPRAWIELRHAAVNRLLRSPAAGAAAEQRNAQVARILNQMIDLDELARRALDPYWAERTPAERDEFIGLLRQLIERNYRQNLDQTLGFAVTYDPEVIDAAANTATVRTVARSRTDARAAPVTVEYRLRRRNNEWIVYDLVTNNASLVASYHESYVRIIRERGFATLLQRMRARVQALRSGAAIVP